MMPSNDFVQIGWDDDVRHACRQLVQLAVLEDLQCGQDWTTLATVPAGRRGSADFVARESGVVAGIAALDVVLEQMHADLVMKSSLGDAMPCKQGEVIATLEGDVRDLLACERILLNFLSRMSGIATHVRQYVDQLVGTNARLYDTRKTAPGWRLLDKYAVRCGGARNHRRGLYDAILIKDNHLAQLASPEESSGEVAARAVRLARSFLATVDKDVALGNPSLVEIEVDSIEQLVAVLAEAPDIVLLDNMTTSQLKQAVALRDRTAPGVQLEASGGVSIATVRQIAATGVDRISAGGLTHAARWLDIGLDWHAVV